MVKVQQIKRFGMPLIKFSENLVGKSLQEQLRTRKILADSGSVNGLPTSY
jgi:hypothetical protein